MTVFIFVASLLAAMALGMPLAFSLVVSGVALMLHMDNFDTQIVSQNLINGADNFPLMAVPFFMLAGELMNAGGMSRRIVNSAMVWVGHFQGGLGYVAVFAAIIMASLSGSAVADTAALAAVLMPMMRDAGYRMDRSAGLIAAGGIIAPVIPPSIGFILFGVIGGVSISKLFMAGIFPGILMGLALIVTWWIVARKDNVKVSPRVPMKEKIRVTVDAFWSYLLAVTIIGGMKMGIFTPTEAAVVAVVYSLIVGLFIYREVKFKDLYGIILAAAKTSSVVMFLVAAALVSAWLITVANIPAQIVDMLSPFMDSPTLMMIMLMLMVLVVGTALDFAPTVLILTPVLMPLVRQAGIDPVYFGVMFIINNAIGLLTPPVGTVLNVVCGVGRIPMHEVIKGVMPFLISQVVVMGVLIAFPELVMLPLKWMMAR
ncbi:MAG: TRAP transporter large permease [Limnohabitans sp.]